MISYSVFKTLVKQNLVTNLAVGHETISGDIKAEGVKQALSEERFKQVQHDGKSVVAFMTIRVEDPKLTEDLGAVGITYRGEVTSTWLPTHFILGGPRRAVFARVEFSH